jgi:hypothetical protein
MTTAKVGTRVEVKPLPDILATLDDHGRLDFLPFMPEMAQYCGQEFTVVGSAHKVCDPSGKSILRSMDNTVYLPTRCDGSGHDGCQARCLIFWRTEWLKPASGNAINNPVTIGKLPEAITKFTKHQSRSKGEPLYRCQVTEIHAASSPISKFDIDKFIKDLTSKNLGMLTFGRFFSKAVVDTLISKASKLVRLRSAFHPPPPRRGTTIQQEKLNLQPGEVVQVRPAADIEATLNDNWKNRGLPVERDMLRYCGKSFKVIGYVKQMIEETSGRMMKFNLDCVILEGVVCPGLDRFKLFCSRKPYYYWREMWLQRVDENKGKSSENAAVR